MKQHVAQPFVDGSYPFAEVLSHSGLFPNGSAGTLKSLTELCRVLKDEYLFQVEFICEVVAEQTVYFKVPDGYSESCIEWLQEILHYHSPIGTRCIIVESDESIDSLEFIFNMRGAIYSSTMEALAATEGKKIKYSNRGFGNIKVAVDSVLGMTEEERAELSSKPSCIVHIVRDSDWKGGRL